MKVLIIDDHSLFRVGLEGLLERRDIHVVSSGEGREGIRLVNEVNPDVVLLDLRMPETGGLEVLQSLHEKYADIPVVMLTTSTDEDDLAECLRAGASGYLLKDMEPDELVLALKEIVAGETVVAPGLTGTLANLVKQGEREEKDQSTPFDNLTPREREILCHLAEGQSNKMIARDLDISDGTVKLHVKAILRKLSVHSRVEAAVMAVESGICSRSRADV